MSILGNIIWFIFGGLVLGLSWFAVGIFWCLTIIGIPIGRQCFKIASLCFFPFGRDIYFDGDTGSFFLNLLWFLLFGWALALESFLMGLVFCLTIIGIPFGLQCFKIARLAFAPFGSSVE